MKRKKQNRMMLKEGLNALASTARNLGDIAVPKIEHIEISITLKGGDILLLNIEKGDGETMERSMERIDADPEMSEESEKMLLN
jgi:hypothetical protein|tara:strand:- start:2 stop:253 length:252 start_codon:yes stop_codon:yes gene_type:complete